MKYLPYAIALLLSLLTYNALSDDDRKKSKKQSSNTSSNYQPSNTNGRLLASNCFQCHATNGTGGFERITGGEASEVYDYLGKSANKDIMAAHAQGYNSNQLNALIGYLNQLSR